MCIKKEISPGVEGLQGHLIHEVFANPDQILAITQLASRCCINGKAKGEFGDKSKQQQNDKFGKGKTLQIQFTDVR